MTFASYKQNPNWQEAMKLASKLFDLSEELPEREQTTLAVELRGLATEVPAAVAEAVVKGSHPRLQPILRVDAALELINQIYPALDTASATRSIERLLADTDGGASEESSSEMSVPVSG